MQYQLKGVVKISGKILAVTSLHIGGTVQGYEIGGMDNPVIKEPISGYPYIPGSSLKGKMRSLLEWELAKVDPQGDVHSCNDEKELNNCPVCRIFGTPAEAHRKIGPTRLIVRDAFPTQDTQIKLNKLQDEKGLPKVEWKTENLINRITSESNPRTVERVPKDSEFNFEFVYQIFDTNDNGKTDLTFLKYLFEAMHLLQDSYLGGYGTRGSGKITFNISQITVKSKDDFHQNKPGQTLTNFTGSIDNIQVQNLINELNIKLGL